MKHPAVLPTTPPLSTIPRRATSPELAHLPLWVAPGVGAAAVAAETEAAAAAVVVAGAAAAVAPAAAAAVVAAAAGTAATL